MEPISTRFVNGQFEVVGYPDAAHVIALSGPDAIRLAAMSSHRSDLIFANESLTQFEIYGKTDARLEEPLWRSAIAHYVKCFKRSARREKLVANDVLQGLPPEAMLAHSYFVALRDKNHAHDENDTTTVRVGAIVNKVGHSHKIARVIAFEGSAVTTHPDQTNNLRLLIHHVGRWVEAEFERLCDTLTMELEQVAHEELLRRPPLEWRAPDVKDVHLTREPHP